MANLFFDTGGNPELYFSNKKARIILTDMDGGVWTAERLADLVDGVQDFVDKTASMFSANGEFTLTICFNGGDGE